jgi:hypothetical protein
MNIILIINGFYDILCAFSILWFSNIPILNFFSSLHISMFQEYKYKDELAINRIMAYWILTYGIVRLIAGINNNLSLQYLAAITYFIEALCLKNECIVNKSLNCDQINFVSILSLIIGLLIIYQIVVKTSITL